MRDPVRCRAEWAECILHSRVTNPHDVIIMLTRCLVCTPYPVDKGQIKHVPQWKSCSCSPQSQRLLACLFIYFDFAFVCEPLVRWKRGLWRLKQWIMLAALRLLCPTYTIFVSPSSLQNAKTLRLLSQCFMRDFSWFLRREIKKLVQQLKDGKRKKKPYHLSKFSKDF